MVVFDSDDVGDAYAYIIRLISKFYDWKTKN